MLKLAKLAILAATVSLALAGAATAAPKPSHHQAWLDSLKVKSVVGGGDTTSVGDAFDPHVEVVDLKADCIGAGGEPQSQIQGDGSVGYRCVPIYMFEQ